MILGLIFAVAGLIVLAFAADHFVAGAARLAVFYNVSPVVIGAVLIGFGTSAPEMVVSGIAAGQGDLDIGVGNIIGSNVANISLVLAAAAAVRTIPVASATLRREVPISVALNQVSLIRPGTASIFEPKDGIVQAWITSVAVTRT